MAYDVFDPMDAIRFGWDGLRNNFRLFVVLMIIVAALYNLPSLIWMIFSRSFFPNGTPSTESLFLMAIPLAIIAITIYLTVEVGLLRIALGFRDNKTPEVEDLFRGYPLLLNYLGASIIYGLMMAIPFLLLFAVGFLLGQDAAAGPIMIIALIFVLPAIVYLFLKYQFYGYLIVDKGMGPVEALQQSSRLTEGALKNLLVFWLVLDCGILVIVMIVGIFIALPVGFLLALISPELLAAFAAAANLVSSVINLLVIIPITKLATAYIYRALEARSAKSASSGILEQEAEDLADEE